MMSLIPTVRGTIEAARSRHFEWATIIGELIDNALDAGASTVDVRIDGRSLSIQDDGDGCADIERMLTLGLHDQRATTKLGRYGVGLKDAAFWAGGPTQIITHNGGIRRSLAIDWDNIAPGWLAPGPTIAESNGRGTVVAFTSISKDRRIPEGARFQEMVASLAFTYTPAIKAGKRITISRGRLPACVLSRHELPPLSEFVDREISVDGKTARVYCGIVADGHENRRPGLAYSHGFRVIMSGALGCGGLGTSRIAGWVLLGKGWRLARNKDDVTAYKDELAEAVFAVVEPLVRKAAGQALSIKTKGLAAGITAKIRGVLGAVEADAKARRAAKKKPSNKANHGRTGGKHKDAERKQHGNRMARDRVGQCRVDFKPCDNGSLGEVDRDGNVVWLAENHPTIAAARDAGREKELLVTAIVLFSAHEAAAEMPMLTMIRDNSVPRQAERIAGAILAEIEADAANTTPSAR